MSGPSQDGDQVTGAKYVPEPPFCSHTWEPETERQRGIHYCELRPRHDGVHRCQCGEVHRG